MIMLAWAIMDFIKTAGMLWIIWQMTKKIQAFKAEQLHMLENLNHMSARQFVLEHRAGYHVDCIREVAAKH